LRKVHKPALYSSGNRGSDVRQTNAVHCLKEGRSLNARKISRSSGELAWGTYIGSIGLGLIFGIEDRIEFSADSRDAVLKDQLCLLEGRRHGGGELRKRERDECRTA
jgi:hypothetical protein